MWSTYVTVRGRSMKRVEEYAPRYGSGLASTVRLCIGAVLPEPNSDIPSESPSETAPDLDQLVDTTSLDP